MGFQGHRRTIAKAKDGVFVVVVKALECAGDGNDGLLIGVECVGLDGVQTLAAKTVLAEPFVAFCKVDGDDEVA